jgi:hypothetical protein
VPRANSDRVDTSRRLKSCDLVLLTTGGCWLPSQLEPAGCPTTWLVSSHPPRPLPCLAVIPTPGRLPGSQHLLPGQHCGLAVIYSQHRDRRLEQEGGGQRKQRFQALVGATEQSPLFQALLAASGEGGGNGQKWYAVPLVLPNTAPR